MKIRSLGNLLAGAAVALLLFSLSALYLTREQIAQQSRDRDAIHNLAEHTSKLRSIVIQTVLYHEERARSLWPAHLEQTHRALESHVYSSREENQLIDEIRYNARLLDVLYRRLMDIPSPEPWDTMNSSQDRELTARTVNSLLLAMQEMLDNANQLVEHNQGETAAAERSLEMLSLCLALALGVMMLVVWHLLRTTILRPVELLQRGTEVVKQGNLAHRIELSETNEIGVLAGTFDAMTAQLERTLDSLQAEIAERQQTQALLSLRTETLAQELAERKRAEENKAAGDRLLARILQTLPVAVFCKNIQQDFVYTVWNKKAEEIFGLSAGECLGKTDFDLFPHQNAAWFRQADIEAAKISGVLDIAEEMVESKQRTVIVHTQKTVVYDAAGRPHYLLGVAEDITQRTQIDRMKTEFISTVSHELRTPLTSIRGSLALLEAGVCGPLAPKAMQLVGVAHKNSQRLIGLVNDILDMEKLASGALELQIQQLDLVQLARQAMEANAGYAASFHVRYVFAAHPDQAWVLADPGRAMQVLTNLLSNAAKFSPAGQLVELRLLARDGQYRLEVRDRGPGIPESFRNRIFERFAQADSTNTRQQGGTGLGLNISRTLIEKMNGQIGFETEVGAGSVFWISLPWATAPADAELIDADDFLPLPRQR